ncbi:hypothetical protein PYJP_07890 [Pyrofollis japonicus]|nr:hypothetical protein PYJP_07890 [Pyrofollis japonicus]
MMESMRRCREQVFGEKRCEDVIEELGTLISRDPRPCSVAGTMVAEPFDVAAEAYRMFMHVNYNDPASFNSVHVVKERLEALISELLGRRIRLLYTYGGSESTLSALYAFRETYGVKGIIASRAAHASVFKACRILGLRCHMAGVNPDLTISVDDVEELVESLPYRVALVATLGLTDNGALDPIEELNQIAEANDIPIYIDAVFGGFHLLAKGETRLLTLGSVKAFSLDPHKLYAPPGSGLLVVLDNDLMNALRFDAPYMPMGSQEGLLWTRNAAGLAATYAGLRLLGREGLKRLTTTLMMLAEELKVGLEEAGVVVYSKPWTPLVAFNVGRAWKRVLSLLGSRGIILYPSRLPGTLRYIVKWCHSRGFVKTVIEAVRESLKPVKNSAREKG